MWPIGKRCQERYTRAFVTADTIDLLGAKMIGIIADRRMTKMHRYLGKKGGTPRLFSGLRVWHGGFGGPTSFQPRQSVSVSLVSPHRLLEGVGFSVRGDETEEQISERYHYPAYSDEESHRDITMVQLTGWPGEPGKDDSILVEYWNENGVGQETTLVFDDVSPVQELAWVVKGDQERQTYWDNEFCTTHDRHIEGHGHSYCHGSCVLRTATMAEDLRLLVQLAESKKES